MFLMQDSGPVGGGIEAAQAMRTATGRTPRLIGDAVKRTLDVTLAACLVLVLSPLMLAVALLVALDGGPIMYAHTRVGRGGRQFGCLKFRTMIVEAEESFDEYLSYHPGVVEEWSTTRKLRFDPRITGIGKMLRSTSLDELPQLLNVLRGEMSLVGPRPVTRPEIALYGEAASLYASVRPGITGLWQVSGRNDVDFAERVRPDERYVLGRGTMLDVSILLRTPSTVLRRRGAL